MAEQNLDIVVQVRGGEVASTEIKGVGTAVEGVGKETETTSKKTAGLSQTLKGLATAAVVYKGFSYIKGAITDTADLARSTVGLQRVTGLDTQQAAGWVELAKERGIQSKQLSQGFITLNKNIYQAAAGSKTTTAAFESLGLDPVALKAASAKTRMSELADAFKALPPGIDKAALANKLYGRQAQSMLPILQQGGKELNNTTNALGKQTGMTKSAAAQALKFVQYQRDWEATQMQLKVAIGTALMPVIAELSKALMPIISAFASAMQGSGAFRFAVIALTAALVVFVGVLTIASAEIAWIPAVIAGVAIALVMLYQKCAWFRAGVNAMASAAKAAFQWIKTAAMAVFNWVKGNWPLLAGLLLGPFALAAGEIIQHWNAIKSAASSVLDFFKQVAGYIGGAFSSAWNTAASAVKGVTSAIQTVIDTAKKVTSLPGKVGGFITSHLPFAAEGGTVTRAGAVLVGEKGPEIVHLPSGSHVIPNNQLASRGRSQNAQSPSYNPSVAYGQRRGRIVVPVYLDTRQIAVAFGEYTADQQAAR